MLVSPGCRHGPTATRQSSHGQCTRTFLVGTFRDSPLASPRGPPTAVFSGTCSPLCPLCPTTYLVTSSVRVSDLQEFKVKSKPIWSAQVPMAQAEKNTLTLLSPTL